MSETAVPTGILHVSRQRILLQGQNTSPTTVCLVVDRDTGRLSTSPSVDTHPYDRQLTVYGLVGILSLPASQYLCVVSEAEVAATLEGCQVIRVLEVKMVPFRPEYDSALPASDESLVALVESQLNCGMVYMCSQLDLTLSCQARAGTSLDSPGWKNICDEFHWNKNLSGPLFENEDLREWIQPAICGFAQSRKCTMNGQSFEIIFISRRSRHRMGTRFFSRGGDNDGNVSNFVETEQIVIANDGRLASFLQIRGSIPLLWTQYPNIKYKPKPTLSQLDSTPCFQKHASKVLKRYENVVCINLVDQKGAELTLADAFKKQCEKLNDPHFKYEAFDFHHECRKMRYDRLSILTDRLSSDQTKHGYFFRNSDGSVAQMQKGVFRTNCVDCLDRTNVVQSLLARISLQGQLEKMKIVRDGEKFESHAEFEKFFKNVWADHADAISTGYSGTGALKTDFTRTGKRSIQGALQDGKNSAVRYYLNNFCDGSRQDSYDFLLGSYNMDSKALAANPYRPGSALRWAILFLLAYAWLIATALVPPSLSSFVELFAFVVVQAIVLYAVLLLAFKAAPWLVDKPKLVPLMSDQKKQA